MTEDKKATPDMVKGVVLRAVDGTLYFIPDSALETFRVTATLAKAAIQKVIASPDSGPVGGHGQGYEAIQVQIPRDSSYDVEIKS
jgi:hypothetical protein